MSFPFVVSAHFILPALTLFPTTASYIIIPSLQLFVPSFASSLPPSLKALSSVFQRCLQTYDVLSFAFTTRLCLGHNWRIVCRSSARALHQQPLFAKNPVCRVIIYFFLFRPRLFLVALYGVESCFFRCFLLLQLHCKFRMASYAALSHLFQLPLFLIMCAFATPFSSLFQLPVDETELVSATREFAVCKTRTGRCASGWRLRRRRRNSRWHSLTARGSSSQCLPKSR